MKTIVSNGSSSSRIFLSVFTLCAAWLFFVNDYSRVELQSPITFNSGLSVSSSTYIPSDDFPTDSDINVEPLENSSPEVVASSVSDDFEFPDIEIPPKDIKEYIKKYAALSIQQMRSYGIPASVSMAQAIVESEAGKSGLALTANAHFGIKCKTGGRGCPEGHCVNFTDDTKHDYFLSYQNVYRSWVSHSELLKGKRYKDCFKQKDYSGWCRALQSAGYATSKKYAKTLIWYIQKYKLYLLDQNK